MKPEAVWVTRGRHELPGLVYKRNGDEVVARLLAGERKLTEPMRVPAELVKPMKQRLDEREMGR